MPQKGLAGIETTKYILEQQEKEEIIVPKRFWCFNSLSKDMGCCFWHFIFYPNGGPERDDIYHPCYEYEHKMLESLEKNRCLAVFKATGLGITEFVLLWALWKCYTDSFFLDKDIIIVTGPNVDLAKGLIRRCKRFISARLDYVDNGEYGLTVNSARIRCYPSNNIHSARGIPKVSLFFGDESAFFKIKDDSTIQTVGERYIGKSNSYVIWVSTAGEQTAGFFYDILNEKNSIYTKLHFYVEAGLKKDPKTGTSIFNSEFIKEASEARSYSREYLGEWGHDTGDIFPTEQIDAIFGTDFEVDEKDSSYDRVMFLDPGFGSSSFGILVGQKQDRIPTIVYSKSYERESYTHILNEIDKLASVYGVRKMRCDASRPELIKDLRAKGYDVVGYSFKEYGAEMTDVSASNVFKLKVKCHPSLKNLKNQLSTIKFNKNSMPDKNDANTFDEGDCFLMANWYFARDGGYVEIAY